MTDINVTQMLTAKEVEKKLQISNMTVNRWRIAGKLRAIEYPRKTYRYYKEDVERILKQGL